MTIGSFRKALLLGVVAVSSSALAQPAEPAAEPASSLETSEDAGAAPEASAETSDAAIEPVAVAADAPVEPVVEEGVAEPEQTSGLRTFMQENVSIHGFGNYSAGITRVREHHTNHYAFGDHDGSFDHVNFSLRELVQPLPELRFAAGQSFSYEDGELRVELDLAGVQWTPNRWFGVRLGRILSPLGIYTETYRVGTLRPFGQLPTAIYANAGFIAQSYDGAELSFTVDTPGGWSARFAAIAGRASIDQDGATSRVVEANVPLPYGSLHSRVVMDLAAGVHVKIDTPVDGLGFAYGILGSTPRYTDLVGDETIAQHWNNVVMVGSAYFLRDNLELRAEVAYRLNHDPSPNAATPTLQKTYGLYVEGAYRVTDHVQLGLRFERMHQGLVDSAPYLMTYGSVAYSNDVGAVASYWLTRDFVMKLEYHFIDGNRFAHPTDQQLYNLVLDHRPLAQQTHFVGFTSAFSF